MKKQFGEETTTFLEVVELKRLYPENNIYTQMFTIKDGISCIIEDHHKIAYLEDKSNDIHFTVGEYNFK